MGLVDSRSRGKASEHETRDTETPRPAHVHLGEAGSVELGFGRRTRDGREIDVNRSWSRSTRTPETSYPGSRTRRAVLTHSMTTVKQWGANVSEPDAMVPCHGARTSVQNSSQCRTELGSHREVVSEAMQANVPEIHQDWLLFSRAKGKRRGRREGLPRRHRARRPADRLRTAPCDADGTPLSRRPLGPAVRGVLGPRPSEVPMKLEISHWREIGFRMIVGPNLRARGKGSWLKVNAQGTLQMCLEAPSCTYQRPYGTVLSSTVTQ